MNFPPETEADLGLFVTVIVLFAIAAFLLIWQLVDHKDVKEDMDDSDLGVRKDFRRITNDEFAKAGLEPPDWATHYKQIKSEAMSDQNIIPIMHWESVKNKQWYWRITSSTNGEILARGSEGYSSEQKCLQGLRATVQEILRASGVITQEPVHGMSKRVADPNA